MQRTRQRRMRMRLWGRMGSVAVLGLMCLGMVPAAADVVGAEGGIVVANRASGSISVIDVETSGVTDFALPAGDNMPEPMYVVYSPSNDLVFVGDRANDRVVAFDARSFDVETTIPTGAGVFHMWGEPSTGQLWVNNDIDNTVTVVDMMTLSTVTTFATPDDLVALGGKPHDVILDPSGPYGYVSMIGVSGDGDYVVKYSADTYTEVDRQAVGNDPHLSLAASHDKLYVPSQGASEVAVLERATLDVITSIPVDNAHGAVTTPDGSVFYTTNIGAGGTDALAVIDTATDMVIGSVDTPYALPHNLALSPAGDLIYITHSGGTSDQTSIVDITDPELPVYLTSVTVGLNPFGIGTVPPEAHTLLGDMNCDGVIDFFDIDGFVMALTDPAGYEAMYPDCYLMLADINGDGGVDFFDIDPFVMLLMGSPETRKIILDFDGLEPLGPGFVYEGWLIVDGAPVSSGRFEIAEGGEAVPGDFTLPADIVDNATMFVLTIEPAPDPDPAPSATHVLAGAFSADSGEVAELTIGHPAALGTDFATAAGAYILATPSTGDIDEDYDQGIWWLDPTAGPAPTLDLPELPAGWVYEGWVAGPDGPITTGRFLAVDAADFDLGGPTAGPDPTPPFPGQDFIEPPLVLPGMAAVISVEPEPDDSPAPFAIKPLVDMMIEDIMPPTLQEMANNSESAPTGTATKADLESSRISMDYDGLEPLGSGYVYEGWLIVDGSPVSSGRFSIAEDGAPIPSDFILPADVVDTAAMFVLTIEPGDDPDPGPSATHVLAGAFAGDVADVMIGHPAALGTDFTAAAGAYILATPSTGDIDEDYDQGIWWLDPTAGPAPTLDLPELPAGWVYEGWVAGPDGPITTGRFLAVDEADFDLGGPTAGPDPTPPFPGQDYIDPALVLPGMAAVISVEPEPDDSPGPFALKPLVDMTIEDLMPPTLQDMANNAGSAPTGVITRLD